MAMIIESETELVDTGVMALAINLALSEPIANRICFANGQDESGRGLKMLLKRAFKRKDVLLLKLIRNIAAQKRAEIKMLFVVCSSYSCVRVVVVAHCSFTVLLEHWAIRTQDYLPDLAQVVANVAGSFDVDFLLECLGALLFCVLCVYLRLQRGPAQSARALELSYESAALVVGILANLELSELDYVAVVQEFALLGWIARKLAASLAAQGAAGAAPLAQSHQRQTGAGARARAAGQSQQQASECADDELLEVVRLLGTLSADEGVARLVLDAGLLNTLIQVLNGTPATPSATSHAHAHVLLDHYLSALSRTLCVLALCSQAGGRRDRAADRVRVLPARVPQDHTQGHRQGDQCAPRTSRLCSCTQYSVPIRRFCIALLQMLRPTCST